MPTASTDTPRTANSVTTGSGMPLCPYPSFVENFPVNPDKGARALAAVGKCRVAPETCTMNAQAYRTIVNKCMEQASHTDKTIRKKFMKQGVAMAKTYLMETLELDVSIIDVEIVVSAEDILKSDGCVTSCFLDAGCYAIVTDGNELQAMDAAKIPHERLVAHFYAHPTPKALTSASSWAFTISIDYDQGTKASAEKLVKMIQNAQQYSNAQMEVHVKASGGTEEGLAAMIAKVSKYGTVALIDPTAAQLGLSYAACMTTDRPDGLFTTVVCTRSGEALGLVYSSKESIVAALECGRGVYYSRSRKGLWRKGDTSGHYQTLHRLDIDCDGDALRFTVTQRGHETKAFCHLNTLTCWGEPRGLRHLEQTLQQRLKSAPEGSYTKRLFEDEELLRDKLVEEAQELSEAQSPQDVAGELADVLYFAMTRAVKAGVSIDNAIEELDRRTRKVTRRKGDSKAFRIEAGESILSKSKSDRS